VEKFGAVHDPGLCDRNSGDSRQNTSGGQGSGGEPAPGRHQKAEPPDIAAGVSELMSEAVGPGGGS
jgi:hypothetical protein